MGDAMGIQKFTGPRSPTEVDNCTIDGGFAFLGWSPARRVDERLVGTTNRRAVL
jgi:hypothetical protein